MGDAEAGPDPTGNPFPPPPPPQPCAVAVPAEQLIVPEPQDEAE